MTRPESARAIRHQLWLGYGLVLAVVVLGATTITSMFQHAAMCRVVVEQAHELDQLHARPVVSPITVVQSVRELPVQHRRRGDQ